MVTIQGMRGKMQIDQQILELVCSRLCHDLISPITAANNGLELMGEVDDTALAAEARQLAQQSAHRASVLLQVYRCAYGTAGRLASADVREAIRLGRMFLEESAVTLDALGLDEAEKLGFGRLVLNLVLVASESLPRGGVLSLRIDDGRISLLAKGQQVLPATHFAPGLTLALAPETLDNRTVQAYLAGVMARGIGYTLSVASAPDGLFFSAVPTA